MCDDDNNKETSSFHFVEKRPKVIAQNLGHDEGVIGSLCRLSNRPISPKTQMEQERKIRREIANSNERRRMQSINAGFQSLRALLPHHEGEKLSKAAILQQTTQYIYQVEQEKTLLLSQNCHLKRLVNQQNQDSDGGSSSDSPRPKRKKTDSGDTVEDGPGSVPEPSTEDLKREMIELRIQLEHERRLRVIYEEQTRNLETQLYPERLSGIAQPVQLQYEQPASPTPTVFVEQVAQLQLPAIDLVAMAVKESRVPPIGVNRVKDDEDDDDNDNDHDNDNDNLMVDEDEDDERNFKMIRKDDAQEPMDHHDELMERRRAELDARCKSPRLIESQSPLPAPHSPPQVVPALQQATQPRLYFPSTSRQNLETIVEAIRHLEGDHLFSDDALPLTTVATTVEIKMENEVCCPSAPASTVTLSATDLSTYRHPQQHQIHHHQTHVIQSMQPSRPGVIVSAHS